MERKIESKQEQMKERDKERETKNSKRDWDLTERNRQKEGEEVRETNARQQLSSIIIS